MNQNAKELAPNNRFNKMLIPVILSVFFSFIAYSYIENKFIWTTFFAILGGYLLIGLWIYITYIKSKNIFYDSEYLYLKSYNGIQYIPLENITNIELTLNKMKILGMQFFNYSIEYKENDSKFSEISFWITIGSDRLNDFESTLKNVNSKVKAIHWAIGIKPF